MNSYFFKLKRFASKPATVAFLDQLLVSGGNFICVLFVGRAIGAESLGLYGYAFGIAIFLTLINQILFGQYLLVRRASTKARLEKIETYDLILVNLFIAALAFLTALLIFNLIFNKPILSSILLAAFPVAQGLQDFFRKLAYYVEGYIAPHLNSIFAYGGRIALLLIISPTTLDYALAIFIFSSATVIVIEITSIYKCFGTWRRFLITSTHLITESKYLLASLPVQWGWGQSPIYLIGATLGVKYSGLFLALRSLVKIFNIVLEMIPNYFGRYLADQLRKSNADYSAGVRKVLLLGFALWLPIAIILPFYSQDVIQTVFGTQYTGNERLLYILWLFNLINFLVAVTSLTKKIRRETASVLICFSIGLAFLLLSGYLALSLTADLDFLGIAMVCSALLLYLTLKKSSRLDRGNANAR